VATDDDLKTAIAVATAQIYIDAVADAKGGGCRAVVDVCSTAHDKCVKQLRPCSGGRLGASVKPCCTGLECIKKQGGVYGCYKTDGKIPKTWNGGVRSAPLVCNLPPDFYDKVT
jgi:hypothetical protein